MARYRRAGRPSPKTRMVRPLPNTAPFHKASSRRYRAGTRPIETVSLQCRSSSPAAAPFHENPRTGKTRSEARFCFVAGNRDTACLTPRLTDRGIALAFVMPSIPLLRHGNEIGLCYRDLSGKEGGHGSEARDSRCPTPVYPMPIRTAPTVNLVAPEAT